jgi:hypothetical protein
MEVVMGVGAEVGGHDGLHGVEGLKRGELEERTAPGS